MPKFSNLALKMPTWQPCYSLSFFLGPAAGSPPDAPDQVVHADPGGGGWAAEEIGRRSMSSRSASEKNVPFFNSKHSKHREMFGYTYLLDSWIRPYSPLLLPKLFSSHRRCHSCCCRQPCRRRPTRRRRRRRLPPPRRWRSRPRPCPWRRGRSGRRTTSTARRWTCVVTFWADFCAAIQGGQVDEAQISPT